MLEDIVTIDRPDYPGGRTVNVAAQFTLCTHARGSKLNPDSSNGGGGGSNKKFLNMQKIGLMRDMGFGSNQKRFTASLCRIRVYPPHFGDGPCASPQDVTALVYHTGNVVLTGASNVQMANAAAWNLTYYFSKHGIPVQMRNFKVENIVAKFHTGFYVDLAAFKRARGILVKYNPDQFPAAIYKGYRDDGKKFKILVYNTGSLVITGLRTREEAMERYIALCDLLKQYKLDGPLGRDVYRENVDMDYVGRALKVMTSSFESAMRRETPMPLTDLLGELDKSIQCLGLDDLSTAPDTSAQDSNSNSKRETYIVHMPQGDLEWTKGNITYRPFGNGNGGIGLGDAAYVPVNKGKKRLRLQ